MSERLDEKTKGALRSYLADVRSLPNESAKTHRFATLIGELFPGIRLPLYGRCSCSLTWKQRRERREGVWLSQNHFARSRRARPLQPSR
jgi:hypothetical protein